MNSMIVSKQVCAPTSSTPEMDTKAPLRCDVLPTLSNLQALEATLKGKSPRKPAIAVVMSKLLASAALHRKHPSIKVLHNNKCKCMHMLRVEGDILKVHCKQLNDGGAHIMRPPAEPRLKNASRRSLETPSQRIWRKVGWA